MALSTRSTVVAIKKEVTQNTLVAPAAATDFIPILDDFSLTPAFDVLDSTEIQASIGRTKGTKGFENPTGNLSLYWKGSNVEGTRPNWDSLLEAILGGVSVAATEYTVAAGSTISAVNVGVGNGASFEKGEALMVKDSSFTNGYAIRNILSISGDTLNLSQNLPGVPTVGSGLGKCIVYKPTNSSHPSLSIWDYRANGGILQVVGGARPISMSASLTAGEQIQTTFGIEGTEYYYDTIIITATSKYIDFNDGGVKAVSVAEKAYKDPYQLAEAIQTAMDNASTDTITCTYDDSTRAFTIATNGAALSLLSNTGANVANSIWTKIGFSTAADYTAALTYTGSAVSFASSYTPNFDDTDVNVAKNNQVLFGGATDISCYKASEVTLNINMENFKIGDLCSESGRSGSEFTGREVTIDVVLYPELGQGEEYKKFRNNDTVMFTYNFGKKTGGNWTPGTSWNIHLPTAVISNFEVGDDNGLVTISMTLSAFVQDGNPEIYINHL